MIANSDRNSNSAHFHSEMCNHLLSELTRYIDGEAAPEVYAVIERHLAECADCCALVATTRKTVLLAQALPQPAMSAEAKQRLLRALNLPDRIAG
jgi:anti-sigma factor RsiW